MNLETWWPMLSAGLLIFVQIALAVRVMLRRQPLANTHAWLLLILFVPVAGVVLYVLIGEVKLGSIRAKKYERTARGLEPYAARLWARREQDWDAGSRRFRQLATLGSTVCQTPAVEGNDLTLLADAAETLDAMIADIDAAASHVHLCTYIMQPGGKPAEVCEALVRAAGRGVECRVAVDSAGSRSFLNSPLRGRMQAAGVEVVELLRVSLFRLLFRRLDLRNHRKILVIDGHTAYCGSQNITDDSFRPKGPGGPGPWHDATVRVQGTAARALGLLFAADWNSEAHRPIEDLEPYLPEEPAPPEDEKPRVSAVQLLPSGPGARPQAIQSAIVSTMYTAFEELIVTTPYFVPDVTVVNALTAAAARGVEVVLILPERNDAWLVDRAGRASYATLLDAGVRIMRYRPGLLHAKTIMVDREIALIGSANLDQRSFWINFEITLAIYDSNFASHLRMLQRRYMDDSVAIKPADWAKRPVRSKLAESAAELFAPLL